MTLSNDSSVGPEAERRPAGSGTRQRTGESSARLERRPWSGSGHAHASELQPSYWAECLFILNPSPIVSLRGTWNRTELSLCQSVGAVRSPLCLYQEKGVWVLGLAGEWAWEKYPSGNALIRARIIY